MTVKLRKILGKITHDTRSEYYRAVEKFGVGRILPKISHPCFTYKLGQQNKFTSRPSFTDFFSDLRLSAKVHN